MKKYFYMNRYDRLGTIGALLFIFGIVLTVYPNLREFLGIETSSILPPVIAGMGSFIFGLKSLLFYSKGWGMAIGIIDPNMETPFPSKYGKLKLLISGSFYSILGLSLLCYAIIRR